MTGTPVGAPDLRTLIGDYLAMRRALGFKLEGTGRLLFAFADHLERCQAQTVTVEHALRPGQHPPHVSGARRTRRTEGHLVGESAPPT